MDPYAFFFGNREPMIYIYTHGCWSKLGTPIVGWLLLKIDLYLWSPRSLILTHSHVYMRMYDVIVHQMELNRQF